MSKLARRTCGLLLVVSCAVAHTVALVPQEADDRARGRALAHLLHSGHADSLAARMSDDIQVVRSGSTHAGDGAANEDYYFGEPILAPADGRVVYALDTIPDNIPGETNPGLPPGNHVVIHHDNDEYSLLAHLRRRSVTVAVGDRVRSGERIGARGNSGNSSEPNLHYHLQAGARFGTGMGLPAFFKRLSSGRRAR